MPNNVIRLMQVVKCPDCGYEALQVNVARMHKPYWIPCPCCRGTVHSEFKPSRMMKDDLQTGEITNEQ